MNIILNKEEEYSNKWNKDSISVKDQNICLIISLEVINSSLLTNYLILQQGNLIVIIQISIQKANMEVNTPGNIQLVVEIGEKANKKCIRKVVILIDNPFMMEIIMNVVLMRKVRYR